MTFCPVIDFNGNKSRFFLRRSPVKRWIYLDRGVTRLSAVPSIQKSEPKIRFSTRSSVLVRNPLKIGCQYFFLLFCEDTHAFTPVFARQSTSAADCYGSPCNNCSRHVLRHKYGRHRLSIILNILYLYFLLSLFLRRLCGGGCLLFFLFMFMLLLMLMLMFMFIPIPMLLLLLLLMFFSFCFGFDFGFGFLFLFAAVESFCFIPERGCSVPG